MEFRLIPVSNGDNTVFAKVDADDYDYLSRFSWCLSDNGYARRNVTFFGKNYTRWMHRIVADIPDDDDLQGDHINGDRLDNRSENLRIVNGDQNARNRFAQKGKLGAVKFKGVFANRNCSTYQARIRIGDKSIYLGSFANQIDAAKAYDAAARVYFADHAKLNFPGDEDLNQGSAASK